MKETESLWKVTAQAAIIGIAGTAAMLAAETMLFPDVVTEQKPASECAAASCPKAAPSDPAG